VVTKGPRPGCEVQTKKFKGALECLNYDGGCSRVDTRTETKRIPRNVCSIRGKKLENSVGIQQKTSTIASQGKQGVKKSDPLNEIVVAP